MTGRIDSVVFLVTTQARILGEQLVWGLSIIWTIIVRSTQISKLAIKTIQSNQVFVKPAKKMALA